MSPEHKAALAKGRNQARTVKSYLTGLSATQRGRRDNPETLRQRLAVVEQKVSEAEDPLARLKLLGEKRNLEVRLAEVEHGVDIGDLEQKFIEVAAEYGQRQEIPYGAWRDMAVPARVLQKAGISR